MQHLLIEPNVENSRDKRVGEGQNHSSVEAASIFLEGLLEEGHGVDKWFVLVAFEASGNGVDGVE